MPLFIKVAIFFWCIFSIQSSWLHKRSIKINIILYDDVIYKTVYPSHLKRLQIKQNIKNLIFEVILIFSDWILVKQIVIFSTPFCLWGKQIFDRTLPWEMSNFLLPMGRDDKTLGANFDWGGTWVKTPRINAFSRNVNSINSTIFCIHGRIKTFERKLRKQSGERQSPREFIEIC